MGRGRQSPNLKGLQDICFGTILSSYWCERSTRTNALSPSMPSAVPKVR